jgi:hypothetical protein
MILVEENPLEDVVNIKKILGVFSSGNWYDKRDLKDFLDFQDHERSKNPM